MGHFYLSKNHPAGAEGRVTGGWGWLLALRRTVRNLRILKLTVIAEEGASEKIHLA